METRDAPMASRLAGDVLSFDRATVSLAAGVKTAAPVVGLIAAGLALGNTTAAVTMGAGAMVVGLAGRGTGMRAPVATMAVTTAGMGLSTFAGAATGGTEWLHLCLMALWGAVGGLLAALGNAASVVGVQALIGMIVFGRFPESPAAAAQLAGFVIAGGAAQVFTASVLGLPEAYSRPRRLLADAYRRLAELARSDPEAPTVPAAEALDAAGRALDSPNLFAAETQARLRALLDQGRRIRVQMAALAAARRRARRVGADAAEPAWAAPWLEDVASAAEPGRRQPAPPGAPRTAAPAPTGDALVDDLVAALAGQVRAAVMLADGLSRSGGHAIQPALFHHGRGERLRVSLVTIRANLTLRSAACRHAVRLALAVPLVGLLAHHLPLQRSYWVTVSAALILKPDFSVTVTRGAARALGTVAGVGLAGAIAVGLHPHTVGTVVVVGVLSVAMYALWQANFATGVGFVTALIVFLLNLIHPDTVGTAVDRLVDTLMGGAIAVALYAAWPTWSEQSARAALADLAGAQRRYMGAVLALGGTGRPPEETLRAAARGARLARSNAESAVGRSLAEPPSRRIDPDTARGVLAGLRRSAQAVHALRNLPPGAVEDPGTRRLAAALDGAMADIAEAVRTGRAGTLPRLRAQHDALGSAADARVVAATDELVDAIDTVGHILGLVHD